MEPMDNKVLRELPAVKERLAHKVQRVPQDLLVLPVRKVQPALLVHKVLLVLKVFKA